MRNDGLKKAYLAAAAIAAYRIVNFSADGTVAQSAAATDAHVGVLDGIAAAAGGDRCEVCRTGIAEVEYGGSVTRGAQLTADANGKAVVATPAALKLTSLAGGAAGNHTLNGLTSSHTLLSVVALDKTAPVTKAIAGGAAGNHTVTGIAASDTLLSVVFVDATDVSEAVTDLTSEFAISAADTVNNAAGTDTTGGFLLVTYLDASVAAGADLTEEFAISAADTINNAAGTDTTGKTLLVSYRNPPVRTIGVAEVAGAAGDIGSCLLAPSQI
jgi:hypothetical protein